MSKGISNLQIEKAKDIDENFVGVFPANHMNRFIDYKTIVSEKKSKVSLYHSKHG